jgi:integrase
MEFYAFRRLERLSIVWLSRGQADNMLEVLFMVAQLLRIHAPDFDSAAGLETTDDDLPERARMTVREYYESELVESRRRLSKNQQSLDRTTLNRWEKYGGAWSGSWAFSDRYRRWEVDFDLDSAGSRVWLPNPAIGRVTDEALGMFARSFRLAGRAIKTVDQSVRILDYIFGQAAPRDSGSKRGRDDLLRRPVFPDGWELEKLEELSRNEFDEDELPAVYVSPDDVSALYRGALNVHRVTQRLPTRPLAALGTALVVFQANYGLRTSDLLRIQWEKNIDAKATELRYRPKKTSSKRIVLPINPVTAEHLLRSRKRGVPEVFYPVKSARLLLKHWRRIVEASGLPWEWRFDCLGKRYFEPALYSMRSYCATALDGYSPGAGSYVVGHAVPGIKRVTAEHYHNRNEIPDFVRRALWGVSQPSAFSSESFSGSSAGAESRSAATA